MFCLIFFCGFSIFNASCVSLQFQHVECGLSESGSIMLSLSLSTLNACCVWMKLSGWTLAVIGQNLIVFNACCVSLKLYHAECTFCLSKVLSWWMHVLFDWSFTCWMRVVFWCDYVPLSRIPLKCRRSAALQEILDGHKRLHTNIMFYIIF